MRIEGERISRALRVLAGVRNRLKGAELNGVSCIGTETYCNGREQGLCIVVYPTNRRKNPKPLRVMFSEHRVACDAIVVYDELGLGQSGNIPMDGSNSFRNMHVRVFEREGRRGNELAASKAIRGIIESYSRTL